MMPPQRRSARPPAVFFIALDIALVVAVTVVSWLQVAVMALGAWVTRSSRRTIRGRRRQRQQGQRRRGVPPAAETPWRHPPWFPYFGGRAATSLGCECPSDANVGPGRSDAFFATRAADK